MTQPTGAVVRPGGGRNTLRIVRYVFPEPHAVVVTGFAVMVGGHRVVVTS